MAGYQRQSADVLQSLANQFNSVDEIPILSELFSKMLVISAEKNFETVTPGPKKCKQIKPFFSAEHKMAYKKLENVCKEWRQHGRPKEANHPARIAKVASQRNLQKIAREDESVKARRNQDDLMATFTQNISQVCNKLKKSAAKI